MAKTLINARNYDQYLEADQRRIVVGADMILAPSAKDVLSRRGIRIEYQRTVQGREPEPEHAQKTVGADSSETKGQPGGQPDSSALLVQAVVKLLRREYGIDDPQTLQKITLDVMARLNGQAH